MGILIMVLGVLGLILTLLLLRFLGRGHARD